MIVRSYRCNIFISFLMILVFYMLQIALGILYMLGLCLHQEIS